MEKKYWQLDKEAFALIFGIKKLHQYIYMKTFALKTDHKPLVEIFGWKKGIPEMETNRLQRYAVIPNIWL